MIQIGLLPSQTLESLLQDEEGNWINVPEGQTVVPLVKLDRPAPTSGKKWVPELTWLSDRVERGWIEEEADPLSPAEMLTLARGAMASILDGLPLADRMFTQTLRVQIEHALNLGQLDLAQYITVHAEIPVHLEATRTAILALFP